MKFVLPSRELNQLVNKCLGVVSPKPTVPILGNLLIEAANDELVITATDLTVGIRCFTEAKIIEEGVITVPSKYFSSLIKELTATNVEITVGQNEIVEIVADDSRFKLLGMSKNDFPALPNMQGALSMKMKQADLKEMLFRTAFAVSREDTRYVLTGVLLNINDGKATCMGTDGKRLARTTKPIEINSSVSGSYVLPIKAVDEILTNLQNEGDATLLILNDRIAVETENMMLITKLLSGQYPDVNRVIPDRSSATMILHREELMILLRQIALFSEHHSVKFVFTDGELRLNANAAAVGEGKVSMPVNYRGDKFEIAFNPNYFLDILRHINAENVALGVTDSYSPGLITEESAQGSPEGSSLFVLMPLRLDE